MRYYVNRQIYWGSHPVTFGVEIAYAGPFPREEIWNYAGPDMVVPELRMGDGVAFESITEAVVAAKEILDRWKTALETDPDGQDCSVVFLGEPVDVSSTDPLPDWAANVAKQEPRCASCDAVVPTSRKSGNMNARRYCSHGCQHGA